MKNENKKDSYRQSQTDKDRNVRHVSNENKDKNASKANSKEDYNKEDAGGTGLGHKKDQGKSIDQELKKQ